MSTANYANSPRYEVVNCSTANTAFDGTGTIVTLFTAGANGSRVDQIGWNATGNTTLGLLKFFARKVNTDPWRFVFAATIPAVTVDANNGIGPHGAGASKLNWVLGAGAEIGVAPHRAEGFNVHATFAGDFPAL